MRVFEFLYWKLLIIILTTNVLKQYDEVKLKKHFNKDAHDENHETEEP